MEQLFHQLKQLRLGHAATALTLQQEQPGTYHDLSFEERLSLLLESELQNRHQTRIQKLKQQAKLRLNASVNQISYRGDRGLNKAQLSELLNGGYLHRKQNILITGPTGAGKTYLACAFGSQACEQQHEVRYYRLKVSALESASVFSEISSSHLKSITSSLDFHHDHSRTC